MKRTKQVASQTRKTHKSRKTEPTTVPDGGPSSTALTTTPAPVLPTTNENPVAGILTRGKPEDAPPATATGVCVLPLQDPEPKTQWWYRPPDSKARKVVDKIVVMRAAGHPDKEIAKKLKTTEQSVRQYVYLAHKNGWLDDHDEPVDIEAELALTIDRKVVRNVGASLDGQMTNWQTHEMTMAAAKGRGIFKGDATKTNDTSNVLPIVAIQVVMPPVGANDQLPEVREDQMGGVPAYLEGEVDDGIRAATAETGTPGTGPEAAVGTDAQR